MKNIDEVSNHHENRRNRLGYERLVSTTTTTTTDDDHQPAAAEILQSKSMSSLKCFLPVFGSKNKSTRRLTPEMMEGTTTKTTTTTMTLTRSQSARQAGSGQGNNNSNKKLGKTHPLFNFSDLKRSKKAMAKPEFLRYMEYIKEGGTWAPDSNNPAMYYK